MHLKNTCLHFPASFSIRWLAIVLLLLSAPLAARAQTTRGVIVGHVQHKVTQESLKNAEVAIKGVQTYELTDSGGDYVLSGVPAGEAVITVTYIGMLTQEKRVTVPAGGRITVNFEMVPDNFDVGAGVRPAETTDGAPKEENIVKLEKFVVSGEFEGNARAQMEQRNRIGVSQIVTTDAFGETAGGNVAEFMRYMPGVTFTFSDAEVESVALGGADPTAVGVTIDGVKMASSGGGGTGDNARAMQWNLFNISTVESIEVDLTGGGDSAAGMIRIKTKGAFDQKGRRLNYKVFASGNTYQTNFSRSPGGGDGFSRKTTVGFEFNYSEAYFNNRAGLSLTLSHIPHYSYTNHIQMGYGNVSEEYFTTSPQSGKTLPVPYISSINFKDGNNFGFADAVNAKIDYKINPFGKVSIGVNYSEKKNEFWNRGYTFGGIDGAKSTLTHVVSSTNSSGNPTGYLHSNYASAVASNKLSDSFGVIMNFDYNLGRLKFDLAAGYTKANTVYHIADSDAPFFYTFSSSISGVSYTAARSSPSSTDWQFGLQRQEDGTPVGKDWADAAQWTPSGTITGRDSRSNADVIEATANLSYSAPIRMPLDFRLTLQGSREKRFGTTDSYGDAWTYALAEDAPGLSNYVSPYKYVSRMGENVGSIGLPFPDRSALYRDYLAYQSAYNAGLADFIANGGAAKDFKLENYAGTTFAPTAASQFNWLRRQLDPGTETMETLAAATFRITAKPTPRLDIQADLRYDFTDQQSIVMVPLTKGQMNNKGFQDTDVNTREYITAQLRNGERSTLTNRYTFWMPSVAARYKFTKQLALRVSYSKSIGRIPINRLAGRWTFNDNESTYGRVATAPNPSLSPDSSNKILAALSYAIKGGGEINASYSVTSWNGLSGDYSYMNTDPDQGAWDINLYNQLVASYGEQSVQDMINQGYVIRTYDDLDRRKRSVQQFTLSYNQPLPFTNKKVNVMGSFTRSVSDWLRNYQDRSAAGSISYNDRYLYSRLGFTWTDRYRATNNSTTMGAWNEYWRPALLNVNFEATLKIHRRFNPYLVIYNLTNEDGFDSLYNYKNRDYINRLDHPGVRFTIGVKGDF